jgi:hypothetical protein
MLKAKTRVEKKDTAKWDIAEAQKGGSRQKEFKHE